MKHRILIVDDEEDAIVPLRHHLMGAAYEVLHSTDGVDALALAAREAPDLVLADARMPGFDGFGLLAALRANDETAPIPFVFLVSPDDARGVARAMRLGAEACLVKPAGRAQLLGTVGAAIGPRGGRRAAAARARFADADRLAPGEAYLRLAREIAGSAIRLAQAQPAT